VVQPGGDTIFDLSYSDRDGAGRIESVTQSGVLGTQTTTYSYSDSGQLQDLDIDGIPVAPSPAYTYDANGNRLTAPGIGTPAEYDAQDRLLVYGGAPYDYTANGDLLRKHVGAQVTHYDYDVYGNLRSVILPDGSGVQYVIDTLNRRVGAIELDDLGNALTVQR
jgi:YD repeat-containing protein